ncbi:hypothetical protein PPL_00937 [Heterostelium album PN500]|uniref:Reverse transcriptase/retrotransposon-derived protein RNase H-like domain-containing protein n=1 Tax=Heterostelium pallidum (strain ATCC 26659 / Pp 5 / PN500) TaxID=670386 RepID=D3AXN1_HETP5|nr:hypothetical protein PPL_00937 [Heterostelium album PN500]EFA85708.1 hypothetical protein PPL_00937 [Heterostelium album PN500]|eukprot:XP_020437814.1 hypothetical protein PPL_00937 [Heterostelium album PN500]
MIASSISDDALTSVVVSQDDQVQVCGRCSQGTIERCAVQGDLSCKNVPNKRCLDFSFCGNGSFYITGINNSQVIGTFYPSRFDCFQQMNGRPLAQNCSSCEDNFTLLCPSTNKTTTGTVTLSTSCNSTGGTQPCSSTDAPTVKMVIPVGKCFTSKDPCSGNTGLKTYLIQYIDEYNVAYGYEFNSMDECTSNQNQQSLSWVCNTCIDPGFHITCDKTPVTPTPSSTTGSNGNKIRMISGIIVTHLAPQLARLTSTISTKYRKINLTDQEIADFNDIKAEICSSRCLIYTDASDVGSGLMIAQYDDNNNLRPVLFDAGKFDSAQRNYSARDRELLSFIHAVTRFGYLLSRPFTSYIPGKENCMADYLSRVPDFYTPWDNDLHKDIVASYSSELPKATRDWFQSFKRRQDITIINDLYYWIDGDNMRLVMLDPASITSIINEAHSSPFSGHVAYGRMLKVCPMPTFIHQENQRRILASLPLPDRPWCDISMDLLALPAADTGEDNLFVVVDRFTKMTRLFPCHKDVTAIQLVNLFAREIIAVFGAPSSILLTAGGQMIFKKDLSARTWNRTRVRRTTTSCTATIRSEHLMMANIWF